ncbi:aminoacyl-tRNA hydrolase [Patescibacteria group bacterium]|nr:aminoacyl-tRNA hydrolase [Patescibacteria group bacterium]
MHIIVGLGNIGEKYEHTRHNVGRSIVVAWVKKYGGSFVASAQYRGLLWKGDIAGDEVCALLPETFMNESGGSVKKLVTGKNAVEHLVVLYDDIDLPFGTIRISFNRGAGGHNGIKSIVTAIGTEAFIRIRIGIAPVFRGVMRKPKTPDAVLAWVLGDFTKKEEKALEGIATRVSEAIEHIVGRGYESAMNAFNG